MRDNFLLTIIIPVLNEEEGIDELIRRLDPVVASYKHELLFVNDGSIDKTEELLKEYAKKRHDMKIISFSRNFGHQMALSAGYMHAKGDAVVTIDADLQDPPQLMHEMIEKWQQGVDIVYAKRKEREFDTPFKRITAELFYKTVNYFSDIEVPTQVGDYRLLDKKVVTVLNNLPEHSKFLRGLVAWSGFSTDYVYHKRDKRVAGVTKYPFKKMVNFALDGILSFSTKPLRLATYIGFAAAGIGFLGVIYGIFGKLLFTGRFLTGWAALFVAVMFMGGVQLITIGIIGEYIGKIYREVQNRPLYIIKEKVNVE